MGSYSAIHVIFIDALAVFSRKCIANQNTKDVPINLFCYAITLRVVPLILTVYFFSATAAGPVMTVPVWLNSLPCRGQINLLWAAL